MSARELFRATGRISGTLAPIDPLRLRPAHLARYGDLTALRYDYPLVLVDGDTAEPVRTLSGVVDALLREVAPRGTPGERLRRGVLRVERHIRHALASGRRGRLGALWDDAAAHVAERGDTAVRQELSGVRAALKVDGELVDCDGDAAARVLTHLWLGSKAVRAREMRTAIDRLVAKLEDLLRADHLRSEEGRTPTVLAASIGEVHRSMFDFDAMARLLARPSGQSALHEGRRRRITDTIATLRAQRFFLPDAEPYVFAFDRLETAVATFRRRLPDAAAVARAIAIAELETQGNYVEAVHDAYFARSDATLAPEDLARFPDYLVRLDTPASRAEVIGALSSGVPLKIVVATGELLDETGPAEPILSLGAQIATTAMGLGDVFVVQAPTAALHRMRDALRASLDYRGPALVSTYSGVLPGGGIAPYLVSAAALESRAFPAFSYDPSAGSEWAQRFALGPNPQPELTWPEHEITWSDGALRRSSANVPFTFADFVLCDGRHARHFAVDQDGGDGLYAIDAGSHLHRVVVDDGLRHAARRCADAWERLRELDDLKRPRQAEAVEVQTAEPGTPAAPAATEAGAPAAAEPSSGEPYIETPRCTSCNECTNINPRMFAYDANKQAYIKDVTAGTYRQLVEAAEGCQVAIIHPGAPRDPNEPGIDELIARAEPFR